jgi:hypothetical protein
MPARVYRQIGLCTLSILAFLPTAVVAASPCKLPGEILIGEDKDYYYCSRLSCPELNAQLDRDKHALEQLRSAIGASNADLEEWKRENAKAETDALEHAKYFLAQTLLSGFTVSQEAKLEESVKDISRADPVGTTWNMKLTKVANFEHSYARLVTLIAALKVVEFPGINIQQTWADFSERARKLGKEGQVLAATWQELATDPDTRQAFKEHGFEFSADALNNALSVPILQQSLDLGKFISDYGYDVAHWESSRERIMQTLALDDKNLYAECLLSRQMLITFRDYNICRGKMPTVGGPRPEDAQCVDHTIAPSP